eukprot:9467131-Pyramimonas_sp.AAC.1
MTANRCSSLSYWSAELTRKFKIEELVRGQGGDPSRLDLTVISPRAMGQIVGNAISVPLFRKVLDNIVDSFAASNS